MKIKAHYLALFAALSIPDICSAMESDNGETNRKKYKRWFDEYIAPRHPKSDDPFLSSDDCWNFRCAMSHQGRSQDKGRYDRLIFIEPNSSLVCLGPSRFNFKNVSGKDLNGLALNLEIFCNDLISGAEKWLSKNEGSDNYKRNYEKFIRRYENGFPPFFLGIPLIM